MSDDAEEAGNSQDLVPEQDDEVGRAPGLSELTQSNAEIKEMLASVSGESAFARQQVGQLYQAVRQLYDAVSAQCRQMDASDKGVQAELKRLQSTTAQDALAGVFCKLFRDFVSQMNQLDELVESMHSESAGEVAASWAEAAGVARDGLQGVLEGWGCRPMAIAVGETEFDPEQHEAVEEREGDVPADCPEHCIAKVRRRGWTMGEKILQYPQVVVA